MQIRYIIAALALLCGVGLIPCLLFLVLVILVDINRSLDQ